MKTAADLNWLQTRSSWQPVNRQQDSKFITHGCNNFLCAVVPYSISMQCSKENRTEFTFVCQVL